MGLNPKTFAVFLKERAKAKDGYIMCAVGQNPKKLSEWYYNQYTGKQHEKAMYWRDNAQRVWDCQGLADGYVSEMTGAKVNVRARNNYADWCGIRGEGAIPAQYRVPGAAVFIHNGNYISHIGFLVEPVKPEKPEGDWYVVEARGVMYGVVTTKLNSRKWSHWGLMTKYFDYAEEPTKAPTNYGARLLKKGCIGADVADLQRDLISLGFDCGKYGADGEFGRDTRTAVKLFQEAAGIDIDGIAGRDTFAALQVMLPDVDGDED